MFRLGRWFLISIDSAIFKSATSLHIRSNEILKEVEVMTQSGCLRVTWSPRGVFLV